MDYHNMPEFLLDALNFECAWSLQNKHAPRHNYEEALLARLPQNSAECWWRHNNAIPATGENWGENEITSLSLAISNATKIETPAQALSSTLDLQLIARAALRLGAWKLLQASLQTLIYQLRSHCPTPQRMSRACGLVAEWSLADLNSCIAFVYGQESLVWGGEPHRIRSYLAYAQASQQTSDSHAEIDLLLSTEATNRQALLAERKFFGLLHAYRIHCLQALSEDTELPKLDPWPANPDSNTSAVHLANCAAWATQIYRDQDKPTAPPLEALRFLKDTGRWRDRLILAQLTSHPQLDLAPNEIVFLKKLDDLASLFPPSFPHTPDAPYLTELRPEIPTFTSPKLALKSFLSCI